jgi:hypothetical protein
MIELFFFNLLVDEIMAQGIAEETAARYAELIGDTPTLDEQGRVLVLEKGQVIATLQPLKFFSEE